MRILILGAGGFAGPYLLAHLAKEQGHTVYAVKHPEEHTDLSAAAGVYDLLLPDAQGTADLIQRIQPQVIFHLAAQSSVAASWEQPYDTLDINVKGTLNVLEAMRQLHSSARLILIGSAEEYGIPRSNLFGAAEDEPLCPANIYGVTKVCAEQLAMVYHKAFGLDVVAVRAFPHIGAGQSRRFVLSGFCRQAAAIEAGLQPPVMLTGNLHIRRDMTDVRDVVRAYSLLAEKGRTGHCYNVGSGKAVLLADAVEEIRRLCSVPFAIETDPKRLRPVDVPFQQADIRRLVQDTGWAPQISLRRSLADLLHAHRLEVQQRDGC